MLRMMIDEVPAATVTDELPGNPAIPELKDRNPGNPKGSVSAALKVLVDLGSSGMIPVNCMAIFGLSPEMEGGTVGVQRQTTTPIAGHWGAGTYTADISGDRLWLPFDEEGYDVANDAYWRYWMITITPPSGATGSVGEVCLGLAEAPNLNFNYGQGHGQQAPIIEHTTQGGVRWGYQMSKIERNLIDISWAQLPDEQQVENMRRFWHDTERGLYPFVLIPDDTDRMEGCYYSTMPTSYRTVESWLKTYGVGLSLAEVIAYESA